jgi:uncharacterized membrane protein
VPGAPSPWSSSNWPYAGWAGRPTHRSGRPSTPTSPWFHGVIFAPTFIAVVMLVILARKAGSPALRPAAAALVLLVLALVVTFAVNAPINLEQLNWNPQAPPADWASIRDRWQIAHAVRTVFCVIALGCLGVAVIDRPFDRAAVP